MSGGEASTPTSLLDEARSLLRRPGSTCGVELFYSRHPHLAGELREALADPIATASAISDALDRRGIELSADALRRHRKGDCKCRPS